MDGAERATVPSATCASVPLNPMERDSDGDGPWDGRDEDVNGMADPIQEKPIQRQPTPIAMG